MDPLTALAAIKGGIAAGKSIVSMSKEIAGFFDSVDKAKKEHQKKKESIFATANEQAMDTWMKKQQAAEAEAQLRELIVNTKGYSAYQDLLKMCREFAKQRKERERIAEKEAEERQEFILVVSLIIGLLVLGISSGVAVFKRIGLI